MTIGVYMLEHVASGRRYVGKSVNVQKRIAKHFAPGPGTHTHIRSAIAKYGRDAFSWIILEDCKDDATARAREILWIKELNTKTPHGFNLTDGGDGTAGWSPSEEARAKQSAARRGTKRSAATRAKMSEAQRGRVASPETRAKISAGSKGHKRNVGRVLSAETKAKIGAGNSGKVVSEEVRARTSATLRGRVPARNLREVSEETRARLAEAGRGRKHSPETLEKMRQAWVRRRAEKVVTNGE